MRKGKMKKGLTLILSLLLVGFTTQQLSNSILITRGVSTFAQILRTLDSSYVDSLDFSALTKTAIQAMLQEVDPYTEYYSEEDLQAMTMQTTGEYAGIGVTLRERPGGGIIIGHIFAESPAESAGLKVGDEITSIDGLSMEDLGVEEARNKIQGAPGEEIQIELKRLGEATPITTTLQRQIVKMPIIPYYGTPREGIGYIKLASFTSPETADEFKLALEELLTKPVKSLIIDLRNNGGGRMDHAVRICSYILPKGSHVVTMRGRAEWSKTFHTQSDPIVPSSMPIVVLINGQTASASEIVAGALQDYDRAVILGERSFGKGLVQTIAKMPYRSQLKFTNAKYYIPSGRCVQAITYDHSQSKVEARTLPDSLLKPFKTQAGRTVYEGSGIIPDLEVPFTTLVPEPFVEMENQLLFLDFGTEYLHKKGSLPPVEQFEVSPSDVAHFSSFLAGSTFEYDNTSQRLLDSLVIQAKEDGHYNANEDTFRKLREGLSTDLHQELSLHDQVLKQRIAYELLSRYHGDAAVAQYQLRGDPQYERALELLSTPREYDGLLPQGEPAK